MNKRIIITISLSGIALMLPAISQAQTLSDSVYSLHHVLSDLFDQMLPECSQMIDVGRAIAAFAALWYIAYRVWGHIARAEPIDFYPLLRPFGLGIAIALFPGVIAMMNNILQPVSDATNKMAQNSSEAISYYVIHEGKQVTEDPQTLSAGTGNSDQWAQYEQPDNNSSSSSSGFLGGVASFFHFKDMVLDLINQVLQMLYAAAGLAIDTIRTFYMIVLAILGPLVLGLSVFDGFHHTLSHWVSRYVHVFMWLPVANIFSAISSNVMELMIKNGGFGVNTVVYCIFMIICIIGYTAVPSVAGYIMQPGGGSKDTLLHKANKLVPFGKK